MNYLKVTDLLVLITLSVVYFSTLVSSVYLNKYGKQTVDQIKRFGYPVEVYNVISEDNYFLTTIRIPGRRFENVNSFKNASEKPIIFLMHGLFVSSYQYVCTGSNHSIALMLADSGYDVWMPNSRGTIISRKHVYLNPDHDTKYWDFSWHEIGYYDIPANVDLIRNITGKDEMAYVGISQGTTVFFVMGAERPEYNKYFKISILFGPSAYVGHTTCYLINVIKSTGLMKPIKAFMKALDIHELFPSALSSVVAEFFRTWCAKGNAFQPYCMKLITFTLDINYDVTLLNSTNFPIFLRHTGVGASLRQGLHYFQIMTSGEFEQYDFGRKKNMIRYHSDTPPPYNLTNIQVPIILFIGGNDVFAIKVDMDRLTSELPNSTIINVDKSYAHFDYLIADNAPEIVHKRAIKLIGQYLRT